MYSKDIKKYTLINQILNSGAEAQELPVWLAELAGIDFNVAFEVWEYILGTFQKEVANDEISQNLETKMLDMFTKLSEIKTRQLLIASEPLMRLIYGSCATVCTGKNLEILTGFILSGKLEAAEVMLAAVRSNLKSNFGENMRVIVDSVFKTYCENKGVKKCELTRKQSTLLLEYAGKIKGPNRMLLTQRIKEL